MQNGLMIYLQIIQNRATKSLKTPKSVWLKAAKLKRIQIMFSH